jgi:hypothetical protein
MVVYVGCRGLSDLFVLLPPSPVSITPYHTEGEEPKAKVKVATEKKATAKATDKVKVCNSKGRGRNQSNTNQSRGRDNDQKNQGNAGKRHDGEKTKEKGKLRWKQSICHYCEKQGHISRECPKRIAHETTTNTTTNSSQQLTIEDDLDILFQNTLYVRSDDEESDDETMEEEVVYRPTYNMSQETNSSDTVSTAQTTENHDQTETKPTIMGDQSTLTFGGQDGTENSTNVQASFGNYDRKIGQETIPSHCQIQAPPVPGEQPKTLTPPESEQGSNQERTKQTGNPRKMRRTTGVRHTDDEDFIAKKVRSQSREIVENDKKFTDQPNGTENDKNEFQLGESLTFSSEAKGDPKETWGDEHYKPPWGWDPIPFPEDLSWAENNEINERLARERAISGGSSLPPKLPRK